METAIVEWLSNFGSMVFAWSLGIFLVVNGVAAVAFFVLRDRAQVNRWTSRILAVDLLLVGSGVGVPIVTTMARLTVTAVSSAFAGSGMTVARADASLEMEPLGK